MNHAELPVSTWVRRWSHLVAPGASVLDVACGSGRHVRWFAQRGCRVTGVDRDSAAVQELRALAEIVVADIEGAPWPLSGRNFDAVVVTNYLWRDLLPNIIDCLAPGGVLIYETFTSAHATIGKPSNPAFLLRPGELLSVTQGLRVVAFEDGFVAPPERFVQRIVAASEAPLGPKPSRFHLDEERSGAAP